MPQELVYSKAPRCCQLKGWEAMWFVMQAIAIVLFCTCCTFEDMMRSHTDDQAQLDADNQVATTYLANMYPLWMDIHVMIFVGFGFLMCFLKTHCWSSIGLNYVCAAWCIQCGILFQGFWHRVIHQDFSHKINVTLFQVIEGEFCAAAFLITMGALLGKATFPQLMAIATAEAVFFTLNAVILFEVLEVHDIGGAMTIHMFGAYFGLAATYFFENKKALEDRTKQFCGGYLSQLAAMFGTIFLFMYWPSFNAILGSGLHRHRAVVNTVLSITASTFSSVILSHTMVGKIDIEVILNATLSGGVMMGAACDMITMPGLAMLAGAICGMISTLGYLKLNHWCQNKLSLHDTCGVQFLHGIPGTLGSLVAVIAVAVCESSYLNADGNPNYMQLDAHFVSRQHDVKRDIATQTGFQLAGMAVTWAISIPAGALFGFIFSKMPMPYKQFDDNPHFEGCTYGDDTAKFNHKIIQASAKANDDDERKKFWGAQDETEVKESSRAAPVDVDVEPNQDKKEVELAPLDIKGNPGPKSMSPRNE